MDAGLGPQGARQKSQVLAHFLRSVPRKGNGDRFGKSKKGKTNSNRDEEKNPQQESWLRKPGPWSSS